MRMHLAVALAFVACGKSKDSSDEPATAPKVVKKKPPPQSPLPPLAKDPGGATGKPTWAVAFGGFGSTAPRAIATDADGASYLCGYFDGVVDFGGGPKLGKHTAVGASDAFVAKIDPKGAIVWVQTFGGAH